MTVYTAILICVISIVSGLILVFRNPQLDRAVYRILMFGLYFWILVFIQAILASLVYWLFYK